MTVFRRRRHNTQGFAIILDRNAPKFKAWKGGAEVWPKFIFEIMRLNASRYTIDLALLSADNEHRVTMKVPCGLFRITIGGTQEEFSDLRDVHSGF